MNMEELVHVVWICSLTFSEHFLWPEEVMENAKLISFAREQRAHSELNDTTRLLGVCRMADRERLGNTPLKFSISPPAHL